MRNQGSTSHTAPGPRGHVRLGILNVLHTFDQLPLWYTLFHQLGFSLVIAHSNPGGNNNLAGMDSIFSESVCYPAKQAHTRLYTLADRGATHVFFPQYDRISRCAVNCGYADLLQQTAPLLLEGPLQLVAPLLTARRAKKLALNTTDHQALQDCLAALTPNHPVTSAEFGEALQQALAVQQAFDQAIEEANAEAETWARQPGHHGIVLAGRPYHADPALLHGLDQEVTAVGMSVLCGTHVAGPKPPDDGVPPWRAAKHLVKLAHRVGTAPHLDLVCLQAFGCGYDSLNMPEVKATLHQYAKPFTMLQLDDVMNNAQSRIHLRTLAYAIGQGRPSVTPFTPKAVDPVPDSLLALAQKGNPQAFNHLGSADIQAVFSGYPDLCYVVQALAGRATRLVATAAAAGTPLERLAVPYVCKYCMLDALPRIVWRTIGLVPEIDWVDYRPDGGEDPQGQPHTPASSTPAAAPMPTPASVPISHTSTSNSRPIGIMGVAPLAYDLFLNDNLPQFLETLGCHAVIPDQEYLVDEDMSYPNARALFESQGITDALYLNSYRCLKGHMDGHGALRRLRHEHPNLRITVIDYDSEASALNRQNRIALAIHQQG